MKRFFALMMALCMLMGSAAAEAPDGERTVEVTGNGLTVYRVKATGEDDTLQYKLDYPAFESEDVSLAEYLTGAVTEPLLALRRTAPMAGGAAGAKDYIRMMFYASLDFPGILSLEATVLNRSADQSINEMLFFYRIIDLSGRRELSVYDLFAEPREQVDTAIRTAVLSTLAGQEGVIVTDAAQVPAPNSIKLTTDVFQCLYAARTVTEKATTVNVPWAQLGLTPSPLLTGEAAPADGEATDAPAQPDAAQDGAPADEMPAGTAAASGLTGDALLARLTGSDWQTMDYALRFLPDGSVADPIGGEPLFIAYAVTAEGLSLTTAERPDQSAVVAEDANGLLFTFDTETSDFETLLLTPLAAAGDQPAAQADTPTPMPTIDMSASMPPTDIATPTPMPVTGEDADVVAFLTQGLWKKLGTDGDTYYQFLPDGRLLTIQVTPYTVAGGELNGGGLAGTVQAGGTAFTLVQADGGQEGFVLNRAATEVPAEAFVTASPTPTPSPTPMPSPTPTASPAPTPSPTPAPTPSPYEQAASSAPTLAALGDASFAKRQTFKVYSAPDEGSFRDSKAQVTTDETVQIFGVTGEWVLVSYQIGNGSRGRIGYIGNGTLADPDNVAQIAFANVKVKLVKKATATDDPLHGKTKLFEIKKDAEVTLLAFLGTDWAYVETTYKNKPCRAFIPRTALAAE